MVRLLLITVLSIAWLAGCSRAGSTESSAVTDKSPITSATVVPPAPKVDETTGQPIEVPSEETFLITFPGEDTNLSAFEAQWKAAPKAVDYDVIIAADSHCKIPLQAYGDITELRAQTKPLPEGTYYLCVYAIQEKGKLLEAANSPLAFTIDLTPPTAPVLTDVSPNGFTHNNTPLIEWTAASGHDFYDLSIISGLECTSAIQSYPALSGALTSTAVLRALSDGVYSICLSARDKAGNVTEATNNHLSLIVDTVRPRVTSVTSLTPSGTYKAGDEVTLIVTFSEYVTVDVSGGVPGLILETGLTDREAQYVSGSGSDTLTFTYTILAGDNSVHLDAVSDRDAIALNGGVIQDRALNDAVLNVPTGGAAGSLAGNAALVVDTTAPYVVAVSSPNANGYYKLGDVIDITATFSEPVTVTNGAAMAIRLETGSTDHDAVYQSGSGSETLSFRYQIQPNDSATRLGTHATQKITLNGATLMDFVGNPATLALPVTPASATLIGAKNIHADGRAPVISSITSSQNGKTFKAGDKVDVRVVFAEKVLVTNGVGMTIKLKTGVNDALAVYTSGSNSATLVFTYTVAPGDNIAPLAVHPDGIALNGANVRDPAGNDALLTLPAAGNSLAARANITIDTSVPYITGVSALSPDGLYKVGDKVTLTVTFNENVNVENKEIVRLALDTGAYAANSSGTGSSTLSFDYTVGSGEESTALNVTGISIGAGSSLKDLAGNAADLTLPVTELRDVKAIEIDGIPPGDFAITGPAALLYSGTQTAAWTASLDAATYDINVSTANDCASLVHAPSSPHLNVVGSSLNLSLPDGRYYLCVDAKDAVGNKTPAANQPYAFEVETSTVHVSYTTLDSGVYALRHAVREGKTVSPETIDTNAGAVIASRGSLTLDANEKVHVSYTKEVGGQFDLYYAQNKTGSFVAEAAKEAVHPNDAIGLSSSLAAGKDGTARILAHFSSDDGMTGGERLIDVSGSGPFLSTEIQKEGLGHVFQDQSIALDASGVAHVLFVHNDSAQFSLQYRNDKGGSWATGESEVLSAPTCSKYLYASTALSSDNKVHGATLCVSPTGACLVHHVTNASGSWSSTQVGVVASAGCSELTMNARHRPTLALDGDNKVHIVYFDEENAQLMYASDVGGGFTSKDISSGTGWQPTIARDMAGKLYVFYLSTAAGGGDLKLLTNNSGEWKTFDIDITGTVLGIGDAAVKGVGGRSSR